jgi:Kef-type K+ transport system membrane component KefB
MTDHQLLWLLMEIAILIAAARLGGELALRLGIPQVVGELTVGICLGPSLFGLAFPGAFHAMFPKDPSQRALLDVMSWLGVMFLVLLSGLETNMDIVRRAGRAVASGWVGGFMLPFAMGLGLGWVVPANLIGANVSRPVFALFIATAMSISAIPVIARILFDLELLHTRIGMVIMSTAVADDTIGWIILALVSGLASASHHVDGATLATAVFGTFGFLLLAATVGQRLVNWALSRSTRLRIPFAQTSVIMLTVLAFGAITQAVHVHLVLGAFVAGVLITRCPDLNRESVTAIRSLGLAIFVPFFFGYTGIKVDLTSITGSAVPIAIAAVAVACTGKLVGGGLGARLGGLPRWEAAAVGAGLNARGAMELVIAAVGLSIGVLTLPMYSIIVLIAALTSLMAAPLLTYFVRRSKAAGEQGSLPVHGTTRAEEVAEGVNV